MILTCASKNMVRLNSEDFSNFLWCLDIIFSTYYYDRTHKNVQKNHDFFRTFWNFRELFPFFRSFSQKSRSPRHMRLNQDYPVIAEVKSYMCI